MHTIVGVLPAARHNHHDNDDDVAGDDHDQPVDSHMRAPGRPVDQHRMRDTDHYNHHDYHNRAALASAASASAASASAASASAASAALADSAANSNDDYDRAAVLGHPGRIQRHAQGGREGNLRILHRAYLHQSGGAD